MRRTLLIIPLAIWMLVQDAGPSGAAFQPDWLQPNQGCTVLYATDGERMLGGNNEDYFNPLTKVWFIPAEFGSFGRVYFGFDDYTAQGGMNDQGLFFDALALDEMLVISREGKQRYLGNLADKAMRECSTVACVVALFESYYNQDFWSWQFLFGDATGESAIIEPEAIIRQQGGYQVATNFLQSTSLAPDRACWRYRSAVEQLEAMETLSVESLRDVLDSVHVDGPVQTLYSNVYDLKNKLVYLYFFHNYGDVVVLNLEEELARGHHAYDLPSLFPPNQAAESWAALSLREHDDLVESRLAADLDPAVLQAYAGTYQMPPGWGAPDQALTVIAQERSLLLRFPDYRQHELFPASATDFYHVAFEPSGFVIAYEARFGLDEEQQVGYLELDFGSESVRANRLGVPPGSTPRPVVTTVATGTPPPPARAEPGDGDALPREALLALMVLAGVVTGWLLIRRLPDRRSKDVQARAADLETPPAPLRDAIALLRSGDVEAAQSVLRAFLRANPDHSQAWYLWSLVEPSPRGQVNALRQALRLDPDFEAARIRLRELKGRPPSEVPWKPESLPLDLRVIPKPAKSRGTLSSMARYGLRRGLVILLTIVVGVYVTVLITNKTGQLDDNMRNQIERQIRWMRAHDEFSGHSEIELDGAMVRARLELQEAAGLNLPPALRNLRWGLNALTFNWGKTVLYMIVGKMQVSTQGLYPVREVILQHFPNTLLVIGTANLITFVFGLPLALFLASRKQGQLVDRFVTMLSPLSSIPSWVHGVVLVTIFAIQLRLLPFGGKYDLLPAETWLGNAAVVAKHMILPVTAVLLGMFFQLVYSWRTFFVIYAKEDYVDLAVAKGLHPANVERRYILRPALPFAITSFALTLVGFWQMTTALEYFFNWPGIGQLYINHLPQYFEEYFFEGELSIILSLVVIFAYLLGLTVFLLDVIYAWVDPRVRLGKTGETMASSVRRSRRRRGEIRQAEPRPIPTARRVNRPRFRWRSAVAGWSTGLKNILAGLGTLFREVRRYPSAILGLAMVAVFVLGSLCAVIALPYVEIGEQWRSSTLGDRAYVPKNVPGVWANWLRRDDAPSTVVRKSRDGTIEKTVRPLENGTTEINFALDLEYPYTGFAQDLLLYIESGYQAKRPHLFITWLTPDGRTIRLKSPTVHSEDTYLFSEYLSSRSFVRDNEHWQKWFVVDSVNATPAFYVLFADPTAEKPQALPGTYRLEVSALTFEPNTEVDIEFVLLGKVYGWAGTDYLRRDLLVPLLWGLPFALGFGLVGATLTTLLAMSIAAAGVWLGGWVDGLVQRLTEVNMILPILAIGVLLYALYGVSLWTVLAIVIALNVFSSPTKAFRAAFLQVKEAPYIEAARAYGATNTRVIFRYLIPRVIPTLIPQLVTLIPAMVYLEATLGILKVYDPRFPTWGRVIYEALSQQALWGGSLYWVLEPLSLLLLVGLAFALLGFALERILNPRLRTA